MLIISFFLSFLLLIVEGKMNFQRNIWVYWETDFDKAPLITRVSYEKLQKAAIQANWKLILVDGKNIKNYLKDYDRFEQVVKRGLRNTVQQKSDILRISLVEQNGGVWVDFACILFDDLQWLSNEKLFEHMIINRIGTNLDDPDMFMLGEGWHQSPSSYYNENGSLVTDEYFGMAIHFIAAKKKSKIMTEWKQKMYRISSLNYQQLIGQINDKRLYFHNIDRSDVYYSGNIALQSVIQEKQFELDDNLSLFSERKNAYEHYKIWSVHGEVGPIAMTRKHLIDTRDLFMETKQEIQKRAGRLWFYLKLAKFLRQRIQDSQKPSQQYFKKNKQLTIQKILKKGPTNEECSLYYIVKGSILYNFYKDSRYENEIYTPFITVEQRQELKKYCQFIAPSVFYSSYQPKSQGQMSQVQRQLFHNTTNTILGKLQMLWMTNSMVVKAGLEQLRAIIFVLIVYIIFRNTSVKELLNAFLDRYRNEFNEKVPFYQMLKNRLNTLQATFTLQTEPIDYKEVKWTKEKSIAVFVLIMKTILSSISLQFYENIQDLGKYPQYELSLLIMLIIIFVDRWLQKLSSNTNYPSNMFVSIQTVSQAMRFVLYLPLSFIAFIHWDIVYGLAYYHTLVIVGGGMLLYMVLQQLKRRNLNNWLTDSIMSILELSKWIGLLIFVVFYFMKNLRYYRKDHHYIKQSISDIAMYIFTFLFTTTILFLNIKLIKHLISRSGQNQQHQQQGNLEQQQNNNVRISYIKQLLVNTNLVALIVYKTYLIFDQIRQYPSEHNSMIIFQFLILLFIACGLLMQFNVPIELDMRRKVTLAMFAYSVQFIFLIFGLFMLDRIFLNWVVNMLIFIPLSMYAAGVGFLVQQLNTEDLGRSHQQQDDDIEYEIVQTQQQLKYENQPLGRRN